MRTAAVIAGLALVTAAWVELRKSTGNGCCCPFCGFEDDEDEPEC